MSDDRFELAWIDGEYAICRLPAHAVLAGMPGGHFVSITRTAEELSVVCRVDEAPRAAQVEGPYLVFRIVGALPLDATGILDAVLAPLAAAGVPIFATSTFDTDYVLVRVADRERAIAALSDAGHRFATTAS
jgi:uncharacterized protein